MMLEVDRTIAALRRRTAEWRRAGLSIGMVPTMGALHEGHRALVRAARRQNDRLVVTLFVNPAQFAPNEDLVSYPRTEDADRDLLTQENADTLFAPSPSEIYPDGFDTKVLVGGPSAGLESDSRPHFFAGVATVVAKLLIAGSPDRAYFGEKDFQQLLVVKQLGRDLNLPTEIIGCATVRETDGLAMSSRNAYLGPDERTCAPRLFAVLRAAAAKVRQAEAPDRVLSSALAELKAAGFAVEYLQLRNADTLAEVRYPHSEPMRLLAAARLGRTRLIDNVPV